MRSFKTEAVIIKRRKFGEKDRILTLFSKNDGKIEALSKGARRPGSRLSYLSDIGIVAKFHIYKTKSIDITKEVEPIFVPDSIKGNYHSSQKLSHAFKYTDKLFELNQPHPKTYKLLLDLVESVSKQDNDIIFISFILNLISDLGLEPELFNCTHCNKKIKIGDKLIFVKQEGVQHASCCNMSGSQCNVDDVKLMRVILRYPFHRVAKVNVDRNNVKRVYNLIREYFSWHFNMELPDFDNE